MSPRRVLLLFSYAVVSFAQWWCSQGSYLCDAPYDPLKQTDLRCGICRSWTYSANIAGDELRLIGLDGGPLPGDGNGSHNYMVSTTLDRSFDLTNGSHWQLALLPSFMRSTRHGALWSSPDNSTIFAYGGRTPAPNPAQSGNELPTLDVSSEKWTDQNSPISLYRLTDGADVNIPESQMAYYIGGFQDQTVSTEAPSDGLAHYATSVAVFDTGTKIPSLVDAPFLPIQNGAAFHVSIGTGLLIYIGGESPHQPVLNQTGDTNMIVNSWDYVWVYDIKGDKWYNQTTSNAPSPRTEFCGSIMYDGVTNSYQIWTIGGADYESSKVLDTVSVLSIPSFEWFEAEKAAVLMSTACVNVGPQIFVIGGRNEDTAGGGTDYGAIAYIYDVNAQTSTTSYTASHTS